jgi:hypothetical protein
VLTADRVAVPGGHGALLRTAPAPGSAAPGTIYLLTDQGIKYPLPAESTDRVQAALGYRGVRPTPVPAAVLALIPTGAALDPVAATVLAPPATAAARGPSQ